MIWIRSPVWDSVWILSGIPLALLLLGLSGAIPAALLTFWIIVVLQQSHNLAPMVMAWGHRGFRTNVLLKHRTKFITIPALILVGTVLAGWLSEALYPAFFPFRGTKVDVVSPNGWQSPLGLMLGLYFLWNTWHFAKQNFGVLSIYRAKSGSGRRLTDLIFALSVHFSVTVVGVAAMLGLVGDAIRDLCAFVALAGVIAMLSLETKLSPRVAFILTDASRLVLMSVAGFWGFAISGMNHWLVAIGLSGHVYGNSRERDPTLFSAGLIILGTAVFALLFIALPFTDLYSTSGPAPLPWWIRATMPAVSLRLGLGLVHFLYDRWLWQLSNPQVRSTIGADLFVGHHHKLALSQSPTA